MPTLNVERNKRIQNLWILGQTIDQISLSTGIPRSTVGYYVKKFKSLDGDYSLHDQSHKQVSRLLHLNLL